MNGLRLLGMVLGLLLSGCMMPPQTKPMGTAERVTMARQIADPKASNRMDSSLKLDGRAGATAIQRYYLGFEGNKTQAAPYVIINTTPTSTSTGK